MISVPPEIWKTVSDFLTLFSTPVCRHALILMIGAVLATRSRTVTSCLKAAGLKDEEHFTNYHRVLNKSRWDILTAAKILLGLLVALTPAGLHLIIVVDETIERRSGKKIKAKGCYRDAVRSSSKHVIRCFGLKWISMMLIVPLPWTGRPWALPFLTVLASSKKSDESAGRRHKTTADQTKQMIMFIRRQIPKRNIVLAGDGAYAAVSPALCCAGLPAPVTLVTRLLLNAGLYDNPPPDQPG